jgi:hypothetical protein
VLRISYSDIQLWQTCPRKYAYSKLLRKSRVGGEGRALGFGSAFHAAQEALWGWSGDPADPGRLQAASKAWSDAAVEHGLSFEDTLLGEVLLIGYAARWDDLRLSFHSTPLVETKVITPVLDPAGNPDPELELAAVFDVVSYDLDGSTVITEHKTTSSEVDPGAAYWGKLDLNLQASLYWIAATDSGRYVSHVQWDVIRAPMYKRGQATPIAEREYYKRPPKGSGFKPGDLKPGQRETDETADEFAQRIMDKVLADPNAYYGRMPLTRSDDELDRVRADLWQVGTQMRRSVEDGTFPRNLDGCRKFNVDCGFLPVCRGEASIDDPALYRIRPEKEEKVTF